MKIRKNIPLLLGCLFICSTIIAGAQNYISIVNGNGESSSFTDKTIYVDNGNGSQQRELHGLVATNGSSSTTVDMSDGETLPPSTGNGEIVEFDVNLRSTPGYGNDVICVITVGEKVEVLQNDGTFSKVKYRAETGYVKSEYVKVGGEVTPPNPTPTPNAQIINYDVNLRASAGYGNDVLCTIKVGERVAVIQNEGEFSKINYNGTAGYVKSEYVRLDGGEVTPPPTTPTGRIKSVVIDPGHGGSDPGAIGPSGLREKDVVLSVSLKLRDILLSRGYTVNMTRATDVYLTLQERADFSNAKKPDFFLSVHSNSFSDANANGSETFAYSSTGKAADISKLIQKEIVRAMGLRDRGFKTANFYVLKYTDAPASLVELAFISNPSEESLLASDAKRNIWAKALADAIGQY